MDNLHNRFRDLIRKEASPARILAMIVKKKLAARGVKCSSKRSREIGEQLAMQLRSSVDGKLTFTLPGKKKLRKPFDLKLTARDIESMSEKLETAFGEQVMPIAEKSADALLSRIRHHNYEGMKLRHYDMARFRRNLKRRWGKAFTSYERFLAVALDSGAAANTYLRSGKDGKPGHLVDALSRVHARACHVGGEVLALLEAGYADGAHARWRTLHELAVVAALLSTHGDELAERYLLHEVVESVRAARQLNEFSKVIDERPLSKREFDRLASMQESLRVRFGADYLTTYGWAAKLLGNSNPNLRKLEAAANLDHLRPYYKLASYNVHASPKGATYRLGLLNGSDATLLAGPSNAGLEEAGRFAAHSLLSTTLCLLNLRTTLDGLVYGKILVKLYRDVEEEFLGAAGRLRADEDRYGKLGALRRAKP